jgi:anti-anti-sigma regulatory factor
MADLSIGVEHLPDHGAYVVSASGRLTASNRHELRAAVLKCLAECPTGVIVDLSGLHLVDRIAGASFVSLRHQAACTGPGIRLLLCGVEDELLALRIRALDRTQRILSDVDEAVAAIHDSAPVSRWLYRRLPAGLQSRIDAGLTIAEACATWELSHMIFDAQAAVFDLFATVRRCPPGQFRLGARRDGDLLLLSLRTPAGEDRPGAGHRVPAGHHHKATPGGHIGWTALDIVAPPAPLASALGGDTFP